MLKLKIDFAFFLLVFIPLPFFLTAYFMVPSRNHESFSTLLTLVILYPIVEEIFFRGIVQSWIALRVKKKLSFLSYSNILTSIIFSLMHLFNHAPIWAIASFVPSLVFGYSQERYKTLQAPVILHSYYNFGYFFVADTV